MVGEDSHGGYVLGFGAGDVYELTGLELRFECAECMLRTEGSKY